MVHSYRQRGQNRYNEDSDMNSFLTTMTRDGDCRLCAASIAVVYSPLVIILAAAAVLF